MYSLFYTEMYNVFTYNNVHKQHNYTQPNLIPLFTLRHTDIHICYHYRNAACRQFLSYLKLICIEVKLLPVLWLKKLLCLDCTYIVFRI